MGRREHETQDMINIAHAFPTMEGYKLQPAKSVIINIQPKQEKAKYDGSRIYSWKRCNA
jgi:hypothetical protein